MSSTNPAAIVETSPGAWDVSGAWTVGGLHGLPHRLPSLDNTCADVVLDGARLDAIDTAGAWVLKSWLARNGASGRLVGWSPRSQALMELAVGHAVVQVARSPKPSKRETVGRHAVGALRQANALLTFLGQTAVTGTVLALHPRRIRWRALLHEIEAGGFDAMPIVGLTSFLLGIVVAYQGADQLRHYGANIFVVDLVGYAMLREFAPLIAAIIIAGRSGSAYAAQIGTMVVTAEVDAMRTIDIDPLERLVLPKLLALLVALPLLTVLADFTGVLGGMIMARKQLGIGFLEFIDRFGTEMQGSTFVVGVGKSLVFSIIIATIGCFQGFRTRGSADSVGRQTTLAVVQSIFLVIVADALFSVAFSIAGL